MCHVCTCVPLGVCGALLSARSVAARGSDRVGSLCCHSLLHGPNTFNPVCLMCTLFVFKLCVMQGGGKFGCALPERDVGIEAL